MRRATVAAIVGLPVLVAAWLPASSSANRVDRIGFLFSGALIGFGLARLLAPSPARAGVPAAPPAAEPAAPSAVPAASTAALLADLHRSRAGADEPSLVAARALLRGGAEPATPPAVTDAPGPHEREVEPEPESFAAAEPVVVREVEPEPEPESFAAAEPVVVREVEPEPVVEQPDVSAPGPAKAPVRRAAPRAAGPRTKAGAAKSRTRKPASPPKPRAAESEPPVAPEHAGRSVSEPEPIGPAVEPAVPTEAVPAVASTPPEPEPLAVESLAVEPEPLTAEPEPLPTAVTEPERVDAAEPASATTEAPRDEAPALAPTADDERVALASIEQLVAERLASRSTSLDDLFRLAGGEPRRTPAPERSTRPATAPPAPATRPPDAVDDGAPSATIVERLARRAVGTSSGMWSMAFSESGAAPAWSSPVSPEDARRATEDAVREALDAGAASSSAADDSPPADGAVRPIVGRAPRRL